MENQATINQQVLSGMDEIAKHFQNPFLTLVVRADNIPGGSLILTRDNVTNPINALRAFRSAMQKQQMTLEDLVELHRDLSNLEQFIGNILPESVEPEKLASIRNIQTVIEAMIKVMKKSAIAHQFQ